ncbi:uncharacterized protein LOC143375343 [Andrena cerasifolii]|uniref:uncharacterized protein LOC143375343 n=1 Tax=Andrena cerasifolii TaxID=2819439 RepID=UPI0040380069
MYEAEAEPAICPKRQTYGPSKKQDRKRKKSQHAPVGGHPKQDRRRSSRGKKISEEAAEDPRKKQLVKRLSKLSKLALKAVASMPVEEEGYDSRMITEEPGRRIKRKQKVLFVLPKPCKSEVCQPKVCCWRDSRRKKGKKRRSGNVSVSVSVTGLMDTSSLRLPKTRRGSRRSLILREMLDPPSVLVHEVERAKRELKEAIPPRDRPIRRIDRTPVCRLKKSSRKRTLHRFKGIQKKESVDEDAKTEEPIDGEGRRKEIVIVDPCSPKKTKDIAEEFSKILDIPVPESIEEEVEGRTYFEEPEAARGRAYPRISEFQSGE